MIIHERFPGNGSVTHSHLLERNSNYAPKQLDGCDNLGPNKTIYIHEASNDFLYVNIND